MRRQPKQVPVRKPVCRYRVLPGQAPSLLPDPLEKGERDYDRLMCAPATWAAPEVVSRGTAAMLMRVWQLNGGLGALEQALTGGVGQPTPQGSG